MDWLKLIPVEKIADQVVPQLFTDIRFRTDVTDEKVVLNQRDLIDLMSGRNQGTGKPNKALAFLKPTVVINSPVLGQKVWAPWGVSDPRTPSIWKNRMTLLVGGTALGLVLIGFGLGRLTKK